MFQLWFHFMEPKENFSMVGKGPGHQGAELGWKWKSVPAAVPQSVTLTSVCLADQPDVCCFPSRCLWEPRLQEPLLCYHPWWGERLRAERGASPVLMHWVISWGSCVQGKGLSIQDVKPCGHQKWTNKIIENRLKLFIAPVFIKYQYTSLVRIFSPSFFFFFFLSVVWNGIFLMSWCFCDLLTNFMFTRWFIGHCSLT